MLQEDARKPFKEMAERAGVSEATIHVRVKRLRREGVIKGFKAIVDPKLVGKATTAFILVKADQRTFSKAMEKVKGMDDVYEVYDVTGSYYAILKVRTKDTEELASLIDKIGSVEGVTATETAVVLRSIKEELTIRL
ncbi:TPA: Lrp/AsnC family transcriptional regulator [Candidatus Bathyarchaeota archaeon]|nr:Lrp/AsnC family transcriptional regulator [Candidatus Bathyarchaeota archaeon]